MFYRYRDAPNAISIAHIGELIFWIGHQLFMVMLWALHKVNYFKYFMIFQVYSSPMNHDYLMFQWYSIVMIVHRATSYDMYKNNLTAMLYKRNIFRMATGIMSHEKCRVNYAIYTKSDTNHPFLMSQRRCRWSSLEKFVSRVHRKKRRKDKETIAYTTT